MLLQREAGQGIGKIGHDAEGLDSLDQVLHAADVKIKFHMIPQINGYCYFSQRTAFLQVLPGGKEKAGIDGRTKKTYNKTQKYPSEGKEEESWL